MITTLFNLLLCACLQRGVQTVPRTFLILVQLYRVAGLRDWRYRIWSRGHSGQVMNCRATYTVTLRPLNKPSPIYTEIPYISTFRWDSRKVVSQWMNEPHSRTFQVRRFNRDRTGDTSHTLWTRVCEVVLVTYSPVSVCNNGRAVAENHLARMDKPIARDLQ